MSKRIAPPGLSAGGGAVVSADSGAQPPCLQRWLGETPVAAFLAEHFGRAPLARPDAAHSALPLFGWHTLDALLARSDASEVLVIARGRLLELPAPRTPAALEALMEGGIGIVVRHAERRDAALGSLAASFARELGGECQIQLFVTPAGTYGFGWHYDLEHVFIAQTAGAKDYFLRANSVATSCEQPDFGRFREERTPLATARLLAGDWLYIPARWWHAAKCVEASLSISVGVRC